MRHMMVTLIGCMIGVAVSAAQGWSQTVEAVLGLSSTPTVVAFHGDPHNLKETILPASRTTGPMTVLFSRWIYPDFTTEPQSLPSAQAMMAAVDAKIRELSYGEAWLQVTFTPVFSLPAPKWAYETFKWWGTHMCPLKPLPLHDGGWFGVAPPVDVSSRGADPRRRVGDASWGLFPHG